MRFARHNSTQWCDREDFASSAEAAHAGRKAAAERGEKLCSHEVAVERCVKCKQWHIVETAGDLERRSRRRKRK